MTAGKVAEDAESSKRAKYEELTNTHIFAPVCIETTGVWGPSANSFICDIGKRIQALTGEPRSTMFLKQSISMAVQRGNVASILGTLPKSAELEEIFDLVGE